MHALTLKEAAERLRVHINTIRIHVKAGQVPAFRIGRCWRIWPADLDKVSNNEQSCQRLALLKEEEVCPSSRVDAVSTMSMSPYRAANALDTRLEQLTGKKRRSTTTHSEQNSLAKPLRQNNNG
jgi:excisionase family DNA binding protein